MHAKVKEGLNKVVDPAVFDVPDGQVPKISNFPTTFSSSHTHHTPTLKVEKGAAYCVRVCVCVCVCVCVLWFRVVGLRF